MTRNHVRSQIKHDVKSAWQQIMVTRNQHDSKSCVTGNQHDMKSCATPNRHDSKSSMTGNRAWLEITMHDVCDLKSPGCEIVWDDKSSMTSNHFRGDRADVWHQIALTWVNRLHQVWPQIIPSRLMKSIQSIAWRPKIMATLNWTFTSSMTSNHALSLCSHRKSWRIVWTMYSTATFTTVCVCSDDERRSSRADNWTSSIRSRTEDRIHRHVRLEIVSSW